MSRGVQRFRQNDLMKAAKGAVKAGLKVARVEVTPDGRIVVVIGDQPPPAKSGWDDIA